MPYFLQNQPRLACMSDRSAAPRARADQPGCARSAIIFSMSGGISAEGDEYGAAWARRVRELQEAVQRHPGTAAHVSLRSIERIRAIQQHNYEELTELLDEPNHNHDLLIELFQNVRDATVRDAYLQLFATTFHNYMASVRTLVDHTRVVVKKVERPTFVAEYERRLHPLRQSTCAAFMQRFRNYVIHYRFPNFIQHVRFAGRAPDEPALQMLLARADLLEWEEWTADAKAYLVDQEEQFDIRGPLREYDEMISTLYNWFFPGFSRAHGDVLAGVNALIDEYNSVLTSDPDAIT